MVISPAARRGHSLPELIVAITFLGVAVGGVGASAWLGARWTDAAVTRQRAVRRAVATLDSLAMSPSAGSGTSTAGGLTVTWRPAGAARVHVAVGRTAPADTLVALTARRVPVVPRLPESP